MPIYEFKCINCNEIVEFLMTSKNEDIDLSCPKCKSEELERVLSVSNYTTSGSSTLETHGRASLQTRTCGSGSCTSYDIPGCG
ncbi:MAG: zinc ribbon domain-containing protein [Desulfobacterales bacterium]|nr:zinc ribbon domain-containing protein [Desulfobacterales bacterium]MBF0395473.1 zinc ribbon domain-containing protein [Desulfobacterales bacterium]